MINNNPIQKLVLDLEFIGIKQSNNYLFDKSSNIAKTELTQVLSDFFDEPQFADLIYEFKSLEFDLGVIPYGNFEEIFVTRFKEALYQKFKDIFENNQNASSYVLKNNENNTYELIKYFLINGRLPWWSSKLGVNNINNVIQDFIKSNKAQFRALLIEIGVDDNVRKRIAYNFSEELIKEMIKVLSPTEFQYIFVYHDYVLTLNQEKKLVNDSESAVSKAIWYNIITYLLTQQSSVFEKKEFLKRNLITVSSFYNLNYYTLLKLLFDASSVMSQSFNTDIYNFIKDIQFIYQEEIDYIEKDDEQRQNPKHIDNINYELSEEYLDYLYVVNYYITNATLPNGYQSYTIEDLKQLFSKLYSFNSNLVAKFLQNVKFNFGTSNRLFKLLSGTNYKFAIDVILKPRLNIDLNDVHKTFIQLLISNNRSTTLYLSDAWKLEILELVYSQKDTITIKHIFQLYLTKYANSENINLQTAIDIYVKGLKLQNNQFILNKLIESQNIEIEEFNNQSISSINNKSILDLLQFLIDFGYMPWWGNALFEESFRKTIEAHYAAYTKDYIKLIKYANTDSFKKSRLINLLGNDKIEFLLLNSITDSELTQIHPILKGIITRDYQTINPKNLLLLLWDTYFNILYKQDHERAYLNKLIRLISSSEKIPIFQITKELLVSFEKEIKSKKLKSLLEELLMLTSGQQSVDAKLIAQLEEQLTLALKLETYNENAFTDFILLLSEKGDQNDPNFIGQYAIDIFNDIVLKGIFPKNLSRFTNIHRDLFFYKLLNFLYLNNNAQLTLIFNQFDSFNNDVKSILFEWIFEKVEDPLANYIGNIILTPTFKNLQFLKNISWTENSIFLDKKSLDSTAILKFNTLLNIPSNISETVAQQNYQSILQQYLIEDGFDRFMEDEDEILKFLIISIFQKGSQFLYQILTNQSNNPGALRKILLLFANAMNIQERQIYNTLLSSIGTEYIFIENLSAENNDSYEINVENIKSVRDIKSIITNLAQKDKISETEYTIILKSIVSSYFKAGTEIQRTKDYLKDEFEYYFKIMILEIVKASSSDFLVIISNVENKKDNILKAFTFFQYDTSRYGLITKNIFSDYFDQHILSNVYNNLNDENVIQSYLEDKNWREDKEDLQFMINSSLISQYDKVQLDIVYTKSLDQFSIFNLTLIKIILNEMKGSFSNQNEQYKFDLVVTRTIINNTDNINRIGQPAPFINIIINELQKATITMGSNFIFKIVNHFEKATITQPVSILPLVKMIVESGNKILAQQNAIINNEIELTTKDQQIIEQTIHIKNEYEFEQKAIQNKLTEEKILENKNITDGVDISEPIYVNNIGLVLFHLFIPTYFNRLNLLNPEGEFIDINAKHRAVHLLQLLVSDTKYDEHELVLNKILCNLEIHEPIPMEIEFTEEERNLSMELVKVVLQRWEKMSNSSIGHFRAAFLMRDGRLTRKEDGWYMVVEKRGYDIILSTIPWAFGVVKFKWMPKFLYTEWM